MARFKSLKALQTLSLPQLEVFNGVLQRAECQHLVMFYALGIALLVVVLVLPLGRAVFEFAVVHKGTSQNASLVKQREVPCLFALILMFQTQNLWAVAC